MKNEIRFDSASLGQKLQMLQQRLGVVDYMLSQEGKYKSLVGFLKQEAEILSAYMADIMNGRLVPYEEVQNEKE